MALPPMTPQQRQNQQAFRQAGMTPEEVRALRAANAQPFSGLPGPPQGTLAPQLQGAATAVRPMSPMQQQRQQIFEAQQASPQMAQIQQLQQQALSQQQSGQAVDPAITQQINALSAQLPTRPPAWGPPNISPDLANLTPEQTAEMQRLNEFQQTRDTLQGQTTALQTAERPFSEFVGQTDVAQTGLSGATEAINRGASGAISALEDLLGQARGEIGAGRERAMEGSQALFERGVSPLEQMQTGAQGAQRQQAALSGALGPEAQAAAIAAFQESPQQAFLREQGERAVTRNAAALGGLGGGEVRRELARFGTGLAAQDFANQFARLGNVADRGLSAAGQAANLGQGQARLQTGIEEAATGGIANLLAGEGRDVANIFGGAASQLAGLRERAGQSLANAISGTTTGLANLTNEQGAALSNIFGEGAANVANLFNLAGQGDAAAQEQLATVLANLGQDEASMLANLFAGQGTARLAGDLGAAGSRRDTAEALLGAVGNIFG